MKDAKAELTGRYGKNPEKWAWGKAHTMAIKHPLGSVLPFYNLKPVPYPGDDFTINAGWYDRENPCNMISGGAIRIVVDMSDIGNMTLVSPPGQSGHYLSPWYSDQAAPWAEGRQIPARYLDAEGIGRFMTLEPK
jgi:penicillin amidase